MVTAVFGDVCRSSDEPPWRLMDCGVVILDQKGGSLVSRWEKEQVRRKTVTPERIYIPLVGDIAGVVN